MPNKSMGYGHKPEGFHPEKHLYQKPPARPRNAQGMTQIRHGRSQHKIHKSPAGRIHTRGLMQALMGMKNRKKPHDGSK